MAINAPFRNLHAFASPVSSAGTIVQIPAAAPKAPYNDRGRLQPPSSDLLGISLPTVSAEPQTDPFGLTASSRPDDSSFAQHSSTSNDMLGLFDDLSVSSGVRTPRAFSVPLDPFGAAAPQPSPSPFVALPPATPLSTVPSSGPSAGGTRLHSPSFGSPPTSEHPQQQPFTRSSSQATVNCSETMQYPNAGYSAPHRHQYSNPQQPVPTLQLQQQQTPPSGDLYSGPSHALVTPANADSMHHHRQHAFGMPPSPPPQSVPTTYGAPASQQINPQNPQGRGQVPLNRSQFDPFA